MNIQSILDLVEVKAQATSCYNLDTILARLHHLSHCEQTYEVREEIRYLLALKARKFDQE